MKKINKKMKNELKYNQIKEWINIILKVVDSK